MSESRLARWWRFDEAEERRSADNPFSALDPAHRRAGGPLIALAFGWGFLITGILAGGALGAGLPLWPDLVWYAMLGNLLNFAIGALVGYIAYKTGCNSALLFRADLAVRLGMPADDLRGTLRQLVRERHVAVQTRPAAT